MKLNLKVFTAVLALGFACTKTNHNEDTGPQLNITDLELIAEVDQRYPLTLNPDETLPEIQGKEMDAGTIQLPLHSILFLALEER